MSSQRCFVPSIADLFFQAWCAGTLAPDERSQVRDLLLDEGISEEERQAIDRLIHCVRRGWLVMDSQPSA